MKLGKFERKHYQRWYGLEYFFLSVMNILGILIIWILDQGLERAKRREKTAI